MTTTMDPLHIGRYRIDGVLGRGAMGVVYRAHDPQVGRSVAIKTVRRDGLDHAQLRFAVARFRREARAAGRLSHPNIVTVHDFGEDASSLFLVCEHVPGESLDRRLAAGGRPPLDSALAWTAQLLVALECAHAHGVVHRDVKASNLLLQHGRSVKLADFGIALVDGDDRDAPELLLGTPSCMAPEQARREAVDARCDVFAAGALLHQLLTGERAFRGSADEAMRQVLEHDPPPPSALAGPALRPFDAVVARALAKSREQRFPSANDFLFALRGAARAAGAACDTALFADDATLALPRRDTGTPRLATVAVSADATRWDVDTLARVESSLRRHVGPIAGALLRKASRDAAATTLDGLLARVARSIPDERARARFLGSFRCEPTFGDAGARPARSAERTVEATVAAALPGRTVGVARGAECGGASQPLDDAAVAGVEARLAQFIGPMAAVVARRARHDAVSARQFVERVAAHLPDAAMRSRFLGESAIASPLPPRE